MAGGGGGGGLALPLFTYVAAVEFHPPNSTDQIEIHDGISGGGDGGGGFAPRESSE